ncbi:MAG: glycine cleavage system aminomethyltransferase GcvT [Dichotomicrobium sp.]
MQDPKRPPAENDLKSTPLHDLHVALGAKMVPFGGYAMPLNYPSGIIAEHNHTRAHAALFDVSHMGQALLSHPEDICTIIERLVPGDIAGLKPGRMRYTQLTNAEGGILDDLMISRAGAKDGRDWLYLVVNAARKEADLAHIAAGLDDDGRLDRLDDHALMAVQGPEAVQVLSRHLPGCEEMRFMSFRAFEDTGYGTVWASRSGYTGEDGFEVSIAADRAGAFARALLEDERVKPAGLGARDTLRLEAGLCLYGHDIDETTSPVEAGLSWSIGKRRRVEGGFPGADRILGELRDGPARLRVGLMPEGRATPREGVVILNADGTETGVVTSGAYSPTLGHPIAMGYVASGDAATGTPVDLQIRGKSHPGHVAGLPFVQHRYATKAKAAS